MKKVLIVDDSRLVCDEVRHQLEGLPYMVASCQSAHAAEEACGADLPDIVLMDIVLPDADGIETTRSLLQRWPSLSVVMLSSLDYDDTEQAAADAGAVGFVPKPFTREQLADALEKAAK